MYYEAIPFKIKKPNDTIMGRSLALVNPKTNTFTTLKVGMATDHEYFIARGFTHWLKPVSNKEIKNKLCTPYILKAQRK